MDLGLPERLMPYKSKAQARYMHARHPEVAKRWDRKYGGQGGLPERKRKKDSRQRLIDQFVNRHG